MSISVDKAVIAKLMKSGQKFEILVDPEKALEVKHGKEIGKDINLDDLLAIQEVFEDSKKGERISPDIVNKTFGSNDMTAIAEKIIKEGDVQLTTEQRNQMTEDKRKLIAAHISKQGVNPQTGNPHPQDRVLRAMDEAKVNIDVERKAEEQVEDILKQIQTIIPIKFEKIKMAVKVPPAHSTKASNVLRKFGTITKEEWANDGSYLCVIEFPAGLQNEFYDKINSLTHGTSEVKILK